MGNSTSASRHSAMLLVRAKPAPAGGGQLAAPGSIVLSRRLPSRVPYLSVALRTSGMTFLRVRRHSIHRKGKTYCTMRTTTWASRNGCSLNGGEGRPTSDKKRSWGARQSANGGCGLAQYSSIPSPLSATIPPDLAEPPPPPHSSSWVTIVWRIPQRGCWPIDEITGSSQRMSGGCRRTEDPTTSWINAVLPSYPRDKPGWMDSAYIELGLRHRRYAGDVHRQHHHYHHYHSGCRVDPNGHDGHCIVPLTSPVDTSAHTPMVSPARGGRASWQPISPVAGHHKGTHTHARERSRHFC